MSSITVRKRSIPMAGLLAIISIAGALGIGTLVAGVSPVLTSTVPSTISLTPRHGDHAPKFSSSSSSTTVVDRTERAATSRAIVQVSTPNSIYGYQPGEGAPTQIDNDGDTR
ncbi:MAG: hypothetical protein ACP5PJ_00590 [Acidimicrobiales bacterium]